MSRKQLFFYPFSGWALYGFAVVCAATMLSCSLDPRSLDPVSSESGTVGTVTHVAARGVGDLSGEVKSLALPPS